MAGGKVAYLYNDYIKDLAAAAIAITNEDANFPEANMQNAQIALCTRTTDKVNIKIQFDVGSNKPLQAHFIGNHNFSGGTFDINTYTNAGYNANKITVETVSVRLLDVYHRESPAPAARRYWEYDLTNVTSAKAYFEIGRTMAYDDFVQLTEIEDWEKPRGYGYENIINRTKYGVRTVHKLTEEKESFLLNWKVRTQNTLKSELRTMFKAISGDAEPFVFIPDISEVNCYYMYCENAVFDWVEIGGEAGADLMSGASISIIEAVRGMA